MQPARARMLQSTEEMLREVGMAGTGIKEVVARSGAPIGSLYHYFPGGKTQLISEALKANAGKSRRLLQGFFDGNRTAAEALRRLFETAADGFERGGTNKACAIGAATLDLGPQDAAIGEICGQTFDAWLEIMTPHLPFPDERSRRAFGVLIVAALEGAFILGKAAHSGDPFREIGRCLATMAASPGPSSTHRSRRARKRA
jgi:TetR/AcrR family transcriptional regulator, lmrAB and yxaGH operons repressor